MDKELSKITHRLKPYKKIPPAMFKTAKGIFLTMDDDNHRLGTSTPRGRK